MQINNFGFAGLVGAGGANPGTAGTGFAQALGSMLGAPTNVVGVQGAPMAGIMPQAAANDSLAPVMPLSMAQLLTTAAPQATAAADALPTSIVAAPAESAASTAAQLPADALPVVVGDAPASPAPAGPAGSAPVAEAKPGKAPAPAPTGPEVPPASAEAVDEAKAEQPAEEPKAPVKRGPRVAGGKELPATDPTATPADAPAADMSLVAAIQTPVQPEIAVRPQPSPNRQIGEISSGTRKIDARVASTGTQSAGPETGKSKLETAVSAVAGKADQQNEKSPGDERGQAPAFTLRHDSPAAMTAHATAEPARTREAAAAAAPEPVIAARPGHLGQQMGVEIARKVEAGDDTLRVRLSPDNLGKVEVTLSFDDAGTLRATVRAESTQALDLLRQDAPDLGRALDHAGIRADAQSFRFESRSDGSGAQAQHRHSQNSAGQQFAGNDEPDTAEAAYRSIRGDGQVDLLA